MNRLVAIAALLGLLLPSSALAWNSMVSSGNPLSWPSGNPETSWRLSSSYTTNDVSYSAVANIMTDSINEWAAPGCTSFNATRGSDTSASPYSTNDNNNTVGFLNPWPGEFGSSALAVTTPVFYTNGEIIKSDISFNNQTTNWVTSNPSNWNQSDLESVAVHEFGHWIGFDHSNYPGSSLNATYSGGTGERTITCDDTEGVCSKYSSSGTACSADYYCPCGESCVDGYCDGIVVGDDDDATGDDDDDDTVGGACEGDPESYSESEPNDWTGEQDVDYFTPGGGDVSITGSISCGNNGQEYTGDYDWYVVDFPCQSEGRFVLDWSGSAYLDYFLYNTNGQVVAQAYAGDFSGAPTYQEEYGGGRMFLLVVCADGPTTNYQFTFDWTPFSALGDDDDDDDASGDDDDAADDDDDATSDDDDASGDDDDASGDDDDDDDDEGGAQRRGGCACSSAVGSGSGAAGLALLLALGGLLRIRRRV